MRQNLTFAQVLSSCKIALLVVQAEKKLINVVSMSLTRESNFSAGFISFSIAQE